MILLYSIFIIYISIGVGNLFYQVMYHRDNIFTEDEKLRQSLPIEEHPPKWFVYIGVIVVCVFAWWVSFKEDDK